MSQDYTDQIGLRLDHPEKVPAEFQHLIPDDQARVEWVLSHEVSGRVLDVGCSDGAISRRIASRWGVAVQPLDKAQWDIREGWPRIVNSELVIALASFDAIFCTEVLEHLFPHEGQRALANLWAVLKPGGTLIITVPNCVPSVLIQPNRHRWAWPDHKRYFTQESLTHLLMDQFGFVGTRVEQIVEGVWLGAVCTK